MIVRSVDLTACLPVVLALGALGCTGPRHSEDVEGFLLTESSGSSEDSALTGTWTGQEGESVLLLQSGDRLATMALDGPARNRMHFAQGRIDGGQVQFLGYRQGVSSSASVGGLDVTDLITCQLDQTAQTLTFSDGETWRRGDPIPGAGSLTGLWRTSAGGRVAVAHEGRRVLALAMDDESKESFSVANARVGDDGRLWTVFVEGGRPAERAIARPSSDGLAIDWPGGGVWHLDERIAGAPPAPPEPQSPKDGAYLPNVQGGSLVWTFDWTDVGGATEYRIEVAQEDAPRPFLEAEGIEASEYVLERTGGLLPRLEGWSWRVAAKTGGSWGAWSSRARFSIDD